MVEATMTAQALYRRWRSRTFEEVLGQEHVTRTLRNALLGGRIAHAYLFAGPRGTGKTTMARLLAKAVNCLSEGEEKPCNQCSICQAINEGRLLDLIEIDAASNRGIDEIRDLREKVGFRPNEAQYKVYVIDEVHMLTNEAFNALLKTLEEPPPHVIFVLATTEPHKIPATILSRCQRFDFRRASLGDLRRKLNHICESEGIAIEEAALELVVRSAGGSFRDAESLLDQLASYGDDEIILAQVQAVLGTVSSQAIGKLVGHLVKRDVAGGLDLINQAVGDGVDPRQFNRELVEYLRGLLLIKAGNGAGLLNVTAEVLAEMESQAWQLSTKALLRTVRLFNQASLDLKASLQPQLPLELAFIEATLDPARQIGATAPCREDSDTEGGPVSETQRRTDQEVTTPPPTSATSSTVLQEGQAAESSSTTQAVAVDTSPQSSSTEEPPMGEESPPASGLTLEQVRLNWAQILAEIRPHNRSAEALLRSGRAEAVEGNVIVLGFPYAFHKERVEEPKCQALIEQVFSQVLGSPCRVKCTLVSKSSTKPTPSVQQSRQLPKTSQPEPPEEDGKDREPKEDKYRAIAKDPVVRAAVEKYGAQVVDVQ
jgi:DNA polymerase-3 subunit gamma/tau